ncbi:FAD/NAD(P)-binding domain-containing protein [Parathielavia appendiculata]|uniref:Squalene monooxygenase n=1 Tax=Parathielavia appendiculata TaxID=2587402 RepID=A0AAN6TTB6_9PEZI|nr:FAD/NAD(P)-binding domain-containing protein [Parathielavia appendiculata]
MTAEYDVLVVGAGIAGCTIASAFARQWRRVLVVERSLREPDRIVGELLQPGGVAALSQLGLAHCLSGIEATPVEGYHLYWKDQQATFWLCPLPGSSKAGGPVGRSFHHGRLVATLRDAVSGLPHETSGAVVGAVCAQSGGAPEKYYASLTVLADGLSSKFRSQFTRNRPKAQSRFWGLELIDADLPRPYACETRILIDILDEIHRRLGNKRIGQGLHPPTRRPNSAAVRTTEPRQSHSKRPHSQHAQCMRCGSPGRLLSPARISSLTDTQAALKEMCRFHWRRKAYSACLNILAQALYLLFVSEHPTLGIIQRGFIRYVQEGERNFAEPAWIMGGLVDDPFRLFYYFFKIAIYSIRLHLHQAGLLGLPAALFQSALLFASAVAIIWQPIIDELQP